MTSLRSSVRPKSSKQPWGTILQPEFGMGYQQMTEYEIEQTTSRLYYVPAPKHRVYIRPQQKQLDRLDVQDMLTRLTKNSRNMSVDANRTQKASAYKNSGVVYSYAWKGYN